MLIRGIAISAALMLGTELPGQSVGFTGIGAEGQAKVAGRAALVRAKVPTFETSTRAWRKGKTVTERRNAEEALSYKSGRWGGTFAVPVSNGKAEARLRVVVVNNQPFAVLGRIRQPLGGREQPHILAVSMAETVEKATQCKVGEGVYAYGPNPTIAERIALPIDCL